MISQVLLLHKINEQLLKLQAKKWKSALSPKIKESLKKFLDADPDPDHLQDEMGSYLVEAHF